MLFYDREYGRVLIDEFTATHEKLMAWYYRTLNKYLKWPYWQLLDCLPIFMEKCETVHDNKIRYSGDRFKANAETSYLVYMYAYSGAIEMLDPLNLRDPEEVTLAFIEAYKELNQRRNEANRAWKEREKEGITICLFSPSDMISIRLEKEERDSTESEPSYEEHFEEMTMQKYLEALSCLTPVQRTVFDAFAANPKMSRNEIMKKLKMDKGHFHRTLERIAYKFEGFLKD